MTSNPPWIEGAKVADLEGAEYKGTTGGQDSARTGAIIIVEKGQDLVDVFYFVFWAFNYGGEVIKKNLGVFRTFTFWSST